MYYLFVVVSSVLTATALAAQKAYHNRASGIRPALILLCIDASGAALLLYALSGFAGGFSLTALAIAAAQALLMTSARYLCTIGGKYGDLLTMSMFLMLGATILPFLAGVTIFGEPASALRITGVILMLVALVLPVVCARRTTARKPIFYILCVLLFLINGLNPILNKVKVVYAPEIPAALYQAVAHACFFLYSAVLLGIDCIRHRPIRPVGAEKPPVGRLAVLAAVYTVGLCFGDWLVLVSLGGLDVSLQAPMSMGLSMIFTAITGRLVFGEKISRLTGLSLLLALVGTVLTAF